MAAYVYSTDKALLRDTQTLLWGTSVREDIFKRWAQGFFFSVDEPTALVQMDGGPCAVIAPVQAFILKRLLLENNMATWKTMKPDKCDELLIKAMIEIIMQVADRHNPKYSVIYTNELNATSNEDKIDSQITESVDKRGVITENKSSKDASWLEPTGPSEVFHSHLRIFNTSNIDDVEDFLTERIGMLKDEYGVLLLLYTVLCTKGLNKICVEMSESSEPMIDSTFGYGSQSLINLMLTGRAVSHVWDHDQDVGGLKLHGIDKQNSVGFLALLEHLRYLEVGTFLKSPSNPVWVLGSETHLTVLFSTDKRLVALETPAEQARRIFKQFDPEGNNFISSNALQDVLAALGLVTDEEYVDVMMKKLDCENLGIILLASFMDEFFPEETGIHPDTFVLYHYNGQPRSNPDNRVKYYKGHAVLLECTVNCVMDSNPMLTVLQTKWPRIDVLWETGQNPSLN